MAENVMKGIKTALLAFLLSAGSASAYAVGVSVTDVASGDGEANFGTTFTQSGPLDTVIDLDFNAFTATSSSKSDLVVVGDTLSMTLTAPAGYLITSISYAEGGTTNTQNGTASVNGFTFIDGTLNNFPNVTLLPETSFPWSFGPGVTPVDNKATVDVLIANFISAATLDPVTDTTISKTFGQLEVGLTIIPIPPAIWMMGAAIAALITAGRRGAKAS